MLLFLSYCFTHRKSFSSVCVFFPLHPAQLRLMFTTVLVDQVRLPHHPGPSATGKALGASALGAQSVVRLGCFKQLLFFETKSRGKTSGESFDHDQPTSPSQTTPGPCPGLQCVPRGLEVQRLVAAGRRREGWGGGPCTVLSAKGLILYLGSQRRRRRLAMIDQPAGLKLGWQCGGGVCFCVSLCHTHAFGCASSLRRRSLRT